MNTNAQRNHQIRSQKFSQKVMRSLSLWVRSP